MINLESSNQPMIYIHMLILIGQLVKLRKHFFYLACQLFLVVFTEMTN